MGWSSLLAPPGVSGGSSTEDDDATPGESTPPGGVAAARENSDACEPEAEEAACRRRRTAAWREPTNVAVAPAQSTRPEEEQQEEGEEAAAAPVTETRAEAGNERLARHRRVRQCERGRGRGEGWQAALWKILWRRTTDMWVQQPPFALYAFLLVVVLSDGVAPGFSKREKEFRFSIGMIRQKKVGKKGTITSTFSSSSFARLAHCHLPLKVRVEQGRKTCTCRRRRCSARALRPSCPRPGGSACVVDFKSRGLPENRVGENKNLPRAERFCSPSHPFRRP